MKFIKQAFMALSAPSVRIQRVVIGGYSGLYCEQGQKGFTIQYKFKSPVTGKFRFLALARFKYGDNINKKMLDGIINQFTLKQSEVLRDIDPLETKQQQREALKAEQSKKTVDEVFTLWTESKEYQSRSESTRRNYEGNYKRHVRNALHSKDISKLTKDAIEATIRPLEGSLYNMALLTLMGICNYAVELKLVTIPATYGIKTRKQLGSKDKVLSEAELSQLMTSSVGWDSLRNICKFQLLTGCRNGEIAGLLWEEIDMTAKTVTISSDRIKTERGYLGQQRDHILPLMPAMSEILLEQRQHGTKGLVFPQASQKTKHKAYGVNSVNDWIQKHLKLQASSHALRHTTATYLAEMDGLSEYDIKIIINHRASGSTAKYIHTQQLNRKRELLGMWHKQLQSMSFSQVEEAVY